VKWEAQNSKLNGNLGVMIKWTESLAPAFIYSSYLATEVTALYIGNCLSSCFKDQHSKTIDFFSLLGGVGVGSTDVCVQGFMLVRQALYHLNHTSSPRILFLIVHCI
jgi:hypothetical protein